MEWVTEKEEWLADWCDARCLKELIVDPSVAVDNSQSRDASDVFFSDVIQAAEKCLVCRASGADVDIFDVSPTVTFLARWRLRLPSSVVPDVGISHVCCPGDASLYIVFLTRAFTIHRVQLILSTDVPEVNLCGSTACHLSSPPATFCALDAHFAAVGCFDGSLHAFRLVGGRAHAEYQFSDSSWLRRMVPRVSAAPRVLAVASLGIDGGSGAGIRLLSFSADGHLRLWQAFERSCRLISSLDVFASAQGQAVSLVGIVFANLRVSSSLSRACLVIRSSVYLIDIPPTASFSNLAVNEIQPPFPSAVPSIVALSHDTLWSFWSGSGRDQLYSLSLEARDGEAWKASVLLANQASSSASPIKDVVTEGSEAIVSSPGRHHVVFTLHHQQEVWRVEEDNFTVERFMVTHGEWEHQLGDTEMVDVGSSWNESFDRSANIEDLVLRWWLQRIFIPGRFSNSVLAQAIDETANSSSFVLERSSSCNMRQAVEEHLRSYANANVGHGSESVNLVVYKAEKLAEVAQAFLSACDNVWKRKHQVCCLGASPIWSQHVVYTGVQARYIGAVPLLLCQGGVSCIRPVQNWSERWWSTFHLSYDLHKYSRSFEIENVINFSEMDEWKLCTTAWSLSRGIGDRIGSANLGLALSMLRHRTAPSSLMCHFVGDVEPHLAQRCFKNIGSQASLASLLEIIRDAVDAMCSDHTQGSADFDIVADGELQLSDVLRGGIVASECEYINCSIRDLLLLSTYALRTNALLSSDTDSQAWLALQTSLDGHLQRSSSLLCSLREELPCLPGSSREAIAGQAHGCDLWATHLRTSGRFGRVPPASFSQVEFAFQLVQRGAWDALRLWCRHQPSDAMVTYFAGRDYLAGEHFDAASEAFLHAQREDVAAMLPKLHRLGIPEESCPPAVAFYVHVSELFAACRSLDYAYAFMYKAADEAEKLNCLPPLRQCLWSEAFTVAVDTEELAAAIEILPKIEDFEDSLDHLGKKLRKLGKLELVLQLPPKHLSHFMGSLRSHAMSPPTPRSDSLACYQILYALHFFHQEYVEAAAVAYNLYLALACPLQQTIEDSAHPLSLNVASVDSMDVVTDMPRPSSLLTKGLGTAKKNHNMGIHASAQVWPVLEQQRNALLMFISAISLTLDKLVVLPPQRSGRTLHGIDAVVGSMLSTSNLETWFSQGDSTSKSCVITLSDAEGLLATVEAYMSLCGHGQIDMVSPSIAARKVARLGLLGLALQVSRACNLDLWQSVFQPFTQFCMEADSCKDEKTWSLKNVCRGEAQAYMFLSSDGCDPMGVEGSISNGLWRTLEEALLRSNESQPGCNHEQTASSSRLLLLVAEEILSHHPDARLPAFLVRNLSGPFVGGLLHLYIRYSRLEDSIELLNEELSRCERWLQSEDRKTCSPLQDFPISMFVQLRNGVRDRTLKDIDSQVWMPVLDKTLAHLENLLVECEKIQSNI